MTRCHYCRRIVWPWQRRGFITGFAVWHPKCKGDER